MRARPSVALLTAPIAFIVASNAFAHVADDTDPPDPMVHSEAIAGVGQASIGLRVFSARRITGNRDFGGHIVVQLPFERLLTQRPAARLVIPSNEMLVDEANSESLSKMLGSALKRVDAGPHRPKPPYLSSPTSKSPLPIAKVKPSLARACVRAAWRANGLGNIEMVDSMKTRARTSALLPETRFRMSRDWDQSYRLSPTNDDPYRLFETNGGGMKVEGTATWKLNRLVFADEELSIERLRVQQSQARSKLAGEVLKALFEWQRSRTLMEDPSIDDAERLEAIRRESEALAILDVLTAGWFSSWLASEN